MADRWETSPKNTEPVPAGMLASSIGQRHLSCFLPTCQTDSGWSLMPGPIPTPPQAALGSDTFLTLCPTSERSSPKSWHLQDLPWVRLAGVQFANPKHSAWQPCADGR